MAEPGVTQGPPASWVGELLVGGFEGYALPEVVGQRLARSELGGVILFRRNLRDLEQAQALCRSIAERAPKGSAPLICIDQEGGRVTRLGAPLLELPPARKLAELGAEKLESVARVLGAQLRALGFTMNFAPVLDVDSNPKNPIIGDRSFSRDPVKVVELGLAFARGLEEGGVLACGKHFPGHGDTLRDSHLELPRVSRPLSELHGTELLPFAAAQAALLPALMTAHVVYDAWDRERAATLSPKICTRLLRQELKFEGALFSDDLEMGAITQGSDVATAATEGIAAGCDLLLICHSVEHQEAAQKAIARRAEAEPAFAGRCREAHERRQALLRRLPGPAAAAGVDSALEEALHGPEATQARSWLAELGR